MSMLDYEVSEAIKRHLSAEVGSRLAGVLAQAEKDAAEVERLTAELASAKERFVAESKANAVLREQLGEHMALDVRIAAVEKRERDATLVEMKFELAAEKRISAFATETTRLLVRNVEYRESVHRTGQENVPYAGGGTYPGGVSQMGRNQQDTTTRTQE